LKASTGIFVKHLRAYEAIVEYESFLKERNYWIEKHMFPIEQYYLKPRWKQYESFTRKDEKITFSLRLREFLYSFAMGNDVLVNVTGVEKDTQIDWEKKIIKIDGQKLKNIFEKLSGISIENAGLSVSGVWNEEK
jgi:hypothetical protein